MNKPFEPNWEMPKTYDQAIAVVRCWANGTSFTFSDRKAKRVLEIVEYTRGVWIDDQIRKDHQIAGKVNELMAISKAYHSAEQLRERIADAIVPHLHELAELRARIEGLEK